ncbi:MAG: hypothetical protein H0T98_00660 [Euzebyaceae bacterium]|nr:hypothetical protein [Euzebyaceae bacterium]
MPSTSGLPGVPRARTSTVHLAVVAVAVAASVVAGAGIGVRSTRGAQVGVDEPQYLLSAMSLAADGDLDITDELAAQAWRPFHESELPQQTRLLPDGRRVSPHDPLLALLLVPGVIVAGWVGAKLTLALLAGLLAGLLTWTAVRRLNVGVPVAAGVVGVFALSAPLAVYGNQIYPELPAALAVTVAIAALTQGGGHPLPNRYRIPTTPGQWGAQPVADNWSRGGTWAVTAAVVALPWLSVKYAPVAATLAAIALTRRWRAGQRRAAAGIAITLVAAGCVFAVVHLAVYTGLTPYAAGDHFIAGELTVAGTAPDFVGRSQRLLGLLVDREFGLAAWQPAWLLLVPAVVWLLRSRHPQWPVLVAPLAVGWLNATFVALTMHGYWFGGRQLVVVLPAAVLAVAVWAQQWRPARVLAGVLGVLGVGSYLWLVVDGLRGRITWVTDFWLVTDPWYQTWSALLPAYQRATWLTWLAHTLWLMAAVMVAGWSWRRGGVRSSR